MKSGTRRERLDRATKRAKRRSPTLTWQEARAAGLWWCIAMWPDFVLDRKAVRS